VKKQNTKIKCNTESHNLEKFINIIASYNHIAMNPVLSTMIESLWLFNLLYATKFEVNEIKKYTEETKIGQCSKVRTIKA
jgi:hypothetical protein